MAVLMSVLYPDGSDAACGAAAAHGGDACRARKLACTNERLQEQWHGLPTAPRTAVRILLFAECCAAVQPCSCCGYDVADTGTICGATKHVSKPYTHIISIVQTGVVPFVAAATTPFVILGVTATHATRSESPLQKLRNSPKHLIHELLPGFDVLVALLSSLVYRVGRLCALCGRYQLGCCMAVPTRARVTLACSLAVIICFAACFSLGVHATLSTSECEKLG